MTWRNERTNVLWLSRTVLGRHKVIPLTRHGVRAEIREAKREALKKATRQPIANDSDWEGKSTTGAYLRHNPLWHQDREECARRGLRLSPALHTRMALKGRLARIARRATP